MAAIYHGGNPKWLQEKNEGKMDGGSGQASYTVDDQITQYKSRSEDPTLKRPS